MEAKKTKGRQKREIKKIENEKDLFITFTKRKSGIYKKASELTTLCGAKVDILIYSPAGKSFCYGEPSLQSMTMSRSNEQHPPKGDIYHQRVEEHKRLEINQLNGKNDALMDQMYVEKEREKDLEGILKTRTSCGWWEAKMEELSHEQAKEMEASLVELQKKLTNELSIKCGENDSHAPIDQTNGVNSYLTYANGSNISEVVFGANTEAYGIGVNESFLPDFSFSPTNEEQISPIDQTNGVNSYLTYSSGSNISEVVFGANTEADGIGANESFLPNFSFSPTKDHVAPIDQTNGVNSYLTYATGSNISEVVFGANTEADGIDANESFLPNFSFSPTIEDQVAPIDQTNGVNSYLTYASGSNISEVVFGSNTEVYGIYGIGASESILPNFAFNPTNEEQIAPIYQTNGVNPYPTNYASGSNISEVVFGANDEAYGIGLSEDILPHFSFSPSNEEQTFNLFPYDEREGDLFDVVFPPKSHANGTSRFLDDPNGSVEIAFASLPTNQAQEVNLTDAGGSGSGSHALAFSPSNQYQGDNSFLYNASNENAGGSGGHALAFSPSNLYQGDNPFLYSASNENADGIGSHALAFSPSNQLQEANPFLYNASDKKGGFSFPLFNGYGHGYF